MQLPEQVERLRGMDYNTKIASLTMMNIEAIVAAAEVAANWAHHGSACQGYLGYSVNKDGEKISFNRIPKDESHLWWQAFDESKCTCGIGSLRSLLMDRRLSEAYCKKEMKRIEGFGATQHHTSNVDALMAEVDGLRSDVVATRKECERLKAENEKLERKLSAVQSAASV